MGGGNTCLDQQPAVLRGTESLLTLCCREVDSNFQYAGTGESRHSSFVVPDCLGRASLPPVRNRWFADPLLEEAGFELFVPLGISASPSWWSRAWKPMAPPNGERGFSVAEPTVRTHLPPAEGLRTFGPWAADNHAAIDDAVIIEWRAGDPAAVMPILEDWNLGHPPTNAAPPTRPERGRWRS